VHSGSTIRQREVHTAEPLVPGPSHLEAGIADEILAELIQVAGETLLSEIHKLIILFRKRKNCLINGRSLLLYQFIKGAIKLTLLVIVGYHCYQLHPTAIKYPSTRFMIYI
jgi:hypothetical protein